LSALVEQHERFQKEEPLALEGVTQAIGEMTAWAEVLGQLSASTSGANQ
jgi:hypothetical protein